MWRTPLSHMVARAQMNWEKIHANSAGNFVPRNCKNTESHDVDTKQYEINILSSLSQSKLSAINAGPPRLYIFLRSL